MTEQKLVFPIEKGKITAGYKNQFYKDKFGYHHYGVDITSTVGNRKVYALGDGVVIAAGLDGKTGANSGLGYITVIKYPGCVSNVDKISRDLIVTTFHHVEGSIRVKAGDSVTYSTVIAEYGNTGGMTTGNHLHLQIDSDTEYPLYCYGISGATSKILKKGTVDSTWNPIEYLWCSGTRYPLEVFPGWAETDWLYLPYKYDEANDVLDRIIKVLKDGGYIGN